MGGLYSPCPTRRIMSGGYGGAGVGAGASAGAGICIGDGGRRSI